MTNDDTPMAFRNQPPDPPGLPPYASPTYCGSLAAPRRRDEQPCRWDVSADGPCTAHDSEFTDFCGKPYAGNEGAPCCWNIALKGPCPEHQFSDVLSWPEILKAEDEAQAQAHATALQRRCQTCRAPAGEVCHKPDGTPIPRLHASRFADPQAHRRGGRT